MAVRIRSVGVYLFLIGTLLYLSGCNLPQQSDKESGSNTGLSNDELLRKAVENMKGMNSYHMSFKGDAPSQEVRMSSELSISADLQFDGRGSTITVRDESGKVSGGPGLILDAGKGFEVRITKDGWYETYDVGKTWEKARGDGPSGIFMTMFGWMWSNFPSTDPGLEKYPTVGENLVTSLDFRDGSPRVEQIDDVATRRMVADLPSTTSDVELEPV